MAKKFNKIKYLTAILQYTIFMSENWRTEWLKRRQKYDVSVIFRILLTIGNGV